MPQDPSDRPSPPEPAPRRSTPAWILHWASHAPDAVAATEAGRSYGYRQLAVTIVQYARLLREAGLRPGLLVGIGCESRFLHLALALAAEVVGAASASFLPAEMRPGTPLLRRCALLCLDAPVPGLPAQSIVLDQARVAAVARSPVAAGELGALDTRPDERAVLRVVRTSGTTDVPKAMENDFGTTARIVESTARLMRAGSRGAAFVALYGWTYRACWTDALLALQRGETVVLSTYRTLHRDLAALPASRLLLLPRDAAWLVENRPPGWVRPPACTLRVDGDFLAPPLRRRLEAHVAAGTINPYSTNETNDVSIVAPDGVGTLLPGVEAAVTDEAGLPLGPGETGIVRVRSDRTVAGYLGDPERTRRHFDRGWCVTGDLGRMPAPGLLVVEGRRDDMLNLGGVKLAPGPLEALLRTLPGVLDAAVLAVPDRDGVGRAHVAVEAAAGAGGPALAERAAALLGTRLGGFTLHVHDALPRTPTGKVRRAALRERLAQPARDADDPQLIA